MQPHNKTSLESFRNIYNAWVNDKVLYGMNAEEILRIIREEWDPGHSVEMWCGHCRAKMLVFAFQRMDQEATQAAPPTDTVKIKLREP